MRNYVFVAALLAMIIGVSQVSAEEGTPGECLLEVSGVKYIDGRCRILMFPGGSFQINGHGKSFHFAIVNLDEDKGAATAHWNGRVRESHAHEQLGQVRRRGACWENAEARICAWRLGTRPRVSS